MSSLTPPPLVGTLCVVLAGWPLTPPLVRTLHTCMHGPSYIGKHKKYTHPHPHTHTHTQTAYFRQHGCTTKEAHAKYNSRAAQLYREKLGGVAAAAQKKYGTEVSGLNVVTICTGNLKFGNLQKNYVSCWTICKYTMYTHTRLSCTCATPTFSCTSRVRPHQNRRKRISSHLLWPTHKQKVRYAFSLMATPYLLWEYHTNVLDVSHRLDPGHECCVSLVARWWEGRVCGRSRRGCGSRRGWHTTAERGRTSLSQQSQCTRSRRQTRYAHNHDHVCMVCMHVHITY